MIAYNKTWLANLRLQAQVKKDVQQGYISQAEFNAIIQRYPAGFYTPNVFVRVGLFILTCVIISFGDGLLSLMAASGNIVTSFGWFFFLGLLSYGGLELMVNGQNYYRSGVDDALLFISGCLFSIGFGIMLSDNNYGTHYLPLSGLIFLLTLGLTIRFADMLVTAVCCISFFAFLFFVWIKIVPTGLLTAPFMMMLAAATVYWLTRKYDKHIACINYANSLVILQVVSLAALYASGNYYVIQTLSAEMMHQAGPVAFGIVFWIWTMGMPLICIAFGIKNKSVILLRMGLIMVTAAAITFRTYYHILPTDVMLTLAGVILIALVYAVIKYLKTPKHGFTYAEPDEVMLADQLKIESLIVAETFSHAPAAPANDNVKFGGGDFGGGGSSGAF